MDQHPGAIVRLERQDDQGPFVEAYQVVSATPEGLTLRHLWSERQTPQGTLRVPGFMTIEITDPREIEALQFPLEVWWRTSPKAKRAEDPSL